MKLSRGFSEPLPSLAVPIFYVCSAAAVILALKRLDLSGHLCHLVGRRHGARGDNRHRLFPRAADLFKMASLALVILGVIGLSLAARQSN